MSENLNKEKTRHFALDVTEHPVGPKRIHEVNGKFKTSNSTMDYLMFMTYMDMASRNAIDKTIESFEV
jgi:hypothetical protein